MQAAEMMSGTRAVYDLVFLICLSIAYVHSFPLQVLPSLPGYIPVYIRLGDQPLEEINPALAEAFHEGSSLSKNTNLNNISNSPDINLEEDEVNKYNVYPVVRVRQVNEKDREPIEEAVEAKASKSIANINKENRREKRVRKLISKSVVKVNPLTEEEKEVLEKLQTTVGEDIKSPNNMHDSNLHLSELPSDKLYHKSKERTFTKVDQIISDESTESDSHPAKDVSKHFTDENPSVSLMNEEPPIKEQPLPHVLSNVRKVAPSPETLSKPEKERTENQSLEEKSK